MKLRPSSNGLSARANRCLSTAGIPAEKEAVLHALKTGALYPYFRPALYGKKTHQEVCRWAGLDESFVSPTIPKSTMPLAIENGLSCQGEPSAFSGRASQPRNQPSCRRSRPERFAPEKIQSTTARKPTPKFVAGRALINGPERHAPGDSLLAGNGSVAFDDAFTKHHQPDRSIQRCSAGLGRRRRRGNDR